jgi:hypothetical protein
MPYNTFNKLYCPYCNADITNEIDKKHCPLCKKSIYSGGYGRFVKKREYLLGLIIFILLFVAWRINLK